LKLKLDYNQICGRRIIIKISRRIRKANKQKNGKAKIKRGKNNS
jgi:hypothetical protein